MDKPFKTDGCTLFPDGLGDLSWRSCCVDHDWAYWQGGTWRDRLNADLNLFVCVYRRAGWLLATVILIGVRIGGFYLWPWRRRWGWGHKWPRYNARSGRQS